MLEQNKIYNIDCLEGFKLLPDNSVDIVITSPPYNIGNSIRGNMYDEYEDTLTENEYYIFIKKVLTELIRVTKNYVFFNFQILSNNKKAYFQLFGDFKDNIKEVIIWHKKQCAPACQETCLSSSFEFILVFCKKELAIKRTFERAFFSNYNKGELHTNVIYGDNMSVTKQFNKFNDTNKAAFPEYLVRELLDKFSDINDLVLDPFMGTGTTAYVCKCMSRNYIGFEISKSYIDVSNERLSQTLLSNIEEVQKWKL